MGYNRPSRTLRGVTIETRGLTIELREAHIEIRAVDVGCAQTAFSLLTIIFIFQRSS